MPRDTRTALLDAAQTRFATHGFPGTSIRDLAADVGIKESSVYNHFASKSALLEAVLARAETRIADVAAQMGAPIGRPDAAADVYQASTPAELDAWAQCFWELWLHDPDVVAVRRLLTLEQYRDPTAARLLRDLTLDQPFAFQVPLFAELIRRGGFTAADPRAVALAFWGPILALLRLAEGPDGEDEARRLLGLHLTHFRDTHVAGPEVAS